MYKESKGRGVNGERHAWSRLTERDVLAIHARLDASDESYAQIGEALGIKSANVQAIANGRSWKRLYRPHKPRKARALGERNASRKHPERLVRGEAHHAAKLKENQVREIKRRLANGEQQTALAREFGIRQTTIWSINAGKTWKSVD